MKTITTPEAVNAGETIVTLADFIRHALLVDQRFNANGAGIRSSAKIEAALASEEALTLEDSDYDLLLAAVETPQPMQGMPPYPLRPARLCAPFLAAIKAAP